MATRRVILHADLDAFYASVEQRDRPELRGKPVLVGGTGPRGVVSAASYEARRYGVHSAMPGFEARRRCPDGIFLRGDMKKYAAVSQQVFAIFRRFSPQVEGLSLDEAFLDLGGSERLLGPARAAGEALRRAVRDEVGLTVSVGIAPSKTVAKIASDEAKPDGLLEIPADAVSAFLAPLLVARLSGVGPVAERKLHRAGLRTIGQLERAAPEFLVRVLGESLGMHVAALARGEDARAVEPDREPVSYSEENTFAEDVADRERLVAVLLDHAESVARRLRRDGWRARTVVLKVKLARRRSGGPHGYPIVTRRATLAEPSDDGAVLAREARRLLARTPSVAVRLLGVGASGLVPADAGKGSGAQLGLFAPAPEQQRATRLNQALDAIVSRFGARAVVRGGQEEAVRAGLSLQAKRGEAPRDAAGDDE